MPRHRSSEGDRGLTREDVGRLYVSGRAELFRLAWLTVGDTQVAEELVQEGYTRLYEHPERVRDAAKADAYVRSIVLNLARGRLSRRGRRGPLERRVARDPTGAGRPPDRDPMSGADDRAMLRHALDALSPNQRVCVVCRYWLGLTDVETAEATGMSLGTVKTHHRRALASLREHLGSDQIVTLEAEHVR